MKIQSPQEILKIRVQDDHPEHPGKTVLTAAGEIDIYTQPCLEEHFGIVDTAKKGVVIDLRKTTYLGGEGVGFLIRMFKRAKEKEKDFCLKVCKKGIVSRMLKMTEVDRFIPVKYHDGINNN
ncbi:MAG: STAS domain-containing protein [Patescibacteria group bacterium]